MSKLTKGTQVYFIDPADDSVVTVECATSFNAGGSPADQIEDTCLESDVRTYKKGLKNPSTATMTINADPENESHVRLHELFEDGTVENIKWVIGWSGDDTAPTVDSNGDWALSTDRTWYEFDGYISDFPFDFALNAVVTTQITIQRSGGGTWTPAT